MRFVRPQLPWQVGEESSVAVWEGQRVYWGPLGGEEGRGQSSLPLGKGPSGSGAVLLGGLGLLVWQMPCRWGNCCWAGAEQHCGLEGLGQVQGSSCPWQISESWVLLNFLLVGVVGRSY